MSRSDVIRAWKDEAFRQSLSEAERALLPQNPAGPVELTEAELAAVAGGMSVACCCSCTCHSSQVRMA